MKPLMLQWWFHLLHILLTNGQEILDCNPGASCSLTCNPSYNCSGLIVNAPTNADLTINCNWRGCDSVTVYGTPSTTSINVNCNNYRSCGDDGIEIYGNGAAEIYFYCNGGSCTHGHFINGTDSNLVYIRTSKDFAQSRLEGAIIYCPDNGYNEINGNNGYSCYLISEKNETDEWAGHDATFYASEGLTKDLHIECNQTENCIDDVLFYCTQDELSSCELTQNDDGDIVCTSETGAEDCDTYVRYNPPMPSNDPSIVPSNEPSIEASTKPTEYPSNVPSNIPSSIPTVVPSTLPSSIPTSDPTDEGETKQPTAVPVIVPTQQPIIQPTLQPTQIQTTQEPQSTQDNELPQSTHGQNIQNSPDTTQIVGGDNENQTLVEEITGNPTWMAIIIGLVAIVGILLIVACGCGINMIKQTRSLNDDVIKEELQMAAQSDAINAKEDKQTASQTNLGEPDNGNETTETNPTLAIVAVESSGAGDTTIDAPIYTEEEEDDMKQEEYVTPGGPDDGPNIDNIDLEESDDDESNKIGNPNYFNPKANYQPPNNSSNALLNGPDSPYEKGGHVQVDSTSATANVVTINASKGNNGNKGNENKKSNKNDKNNEGDEGKKKKWNRWGKNKKGQKDKNNDKKQKGKRESKPPPVPPRPSQNNTQQNRGPPPPPKPVRPPPKMVVHGVDDYAGANQRIARNNRADTDYETNEFGYDL